ncbi:MAG: SCO family protein [Vicinamibacterales bacterium]
MQARLTARAGDVGRGGWRSARRGAAGAATALALLLAAAAPAVAQPSGPLSIPPPGAVASDAIPALREVGIDQKLDAQIPLDLTFTDEAGREVRLGDYFGQRPVILAMVYYECPMLCTLVLNGLVGSVEPLDFTPGQDYEVVVLSFDPGETPALAAQKKELYLKRYGRPQTSAGWHFLTGREERIRQLADAIGFRYTYDASIDQYAHPAAITILTPQGHVSRYLFGIEFAPRDVRLGLVEATAGQIGTVIDQALLFCYHYDPATGKYGLVVMNLIRLGGLLTLVALGGGIFLSVRRERRQQSAVPGTATGTR